jgi:hypothetical protein
MRQLLPLTALALGLSGGVAFADHAGADHRGSGVSDHRGGAVVHAAPHTAPHGAPHARAEVVVRDHREVRPVVVHERPVVVRERVVVREPRGGRVVVRGGVTYRPIYVSRPVIHARYYNHFHRPAVIVEHYGPRPGYLWIGGGWTWDGGEWIWTTGYYQPV